MEPALAIALMALGRDEATLARALEEARAALGPRAHEVRFAALFDEADPTQIARAFRHADVLVASPTRSGFAGARRRALLTALSFAPRGVLVCDGDGLYPGSSIARIALSWLDAGAEQCAVIPQRVGHTLPTLGEASEDRAALERLENTAGALLSNHPEFASGDLQPGAFALPADLAWTMLQIVRARDFSWDLECTLELLGRVRTVLRPEIAAQPQEHTTFTPADLRCKLDMLARKYGREGLRATLERLRDAPPARVPRALVERALAAE